jgi:ABC-type anion transport system duplicated permease subunit
MDSQVEEHSDGGPCGLLLAVSIIQVILLCGSVLLTIFLDDSSFPEVLTSSLGQNSWIALLALKRTTLTVLALMVVGCALGIYTGVLGMKHRDHHEGIQSVVRFLAAFLKHVTPSPKLMLCLSAMWNGVACKSVLMRDVAVI